MSDRDVLTNCLTDARLARIQSVLKKRTRQLCVVIDRLDKPHNYMAVLRTCDAFGIQDVHIIPLPGDDEEVICKKITQGAHKWLTLHMHASWGDCVAALKAADYHLYASYLSDEPKGLEALELAGNIALVFGNELKGLKPEQVADCDGVFMLPMRGFSQSFNISVACALSLQRAFLLREAGGKPFAPLGELEHDALYDEWLYKAVPNADAILAEAKRREQG